MIDDVRDRARARARTPMTASSAAAARSRDCASAASTCAQIAFSTASRSLPPGFPPDTLAREVAGRGGRDRPGRGRAHRARLRGAHVPGRTAGDPRAADRGGARLEPDAVLLPTAEDIHQDHATIAAEGLRAFKRTTVLGYEIPWNQFRFAKQAYVVLEERHVDVEGARARVLRLAAAPQLRQRGVRPQPRAHPRDRDRPALRGVLRGRAVGGLRPLRVLLTATGAPGAARAHPGAARQRRARAAGGRHGHERGLRRALPLRRLRDGAARRAEEFAPAVLALAERHEVDVVFPQSSAEVGRSPRRGSRFPMPVLVSPPGGDRRLQRQGGHGGPRRAGRRASPETVLARTPDEFRGGTPRGSAIRSATCA